MNMSKKSIVKYLKKLLTSKKDDYLLIPRDMVKRIILFLEE